MFLLDTNVRHRRCFSSDSHTRNHPREHPPSPPFFVHPAARSNPILIEVKRVESTSRTSTEEAYPPSERGRYRVVSPPGKVSTQQSAELEQTTDTEVSHTRT